MTSRRTVALLVAADVIAGGVYLGLLFANHPTPEPVAEPMVQETVIGIAPRVMDGRMVEMWRLDGRHTMKHCAEMTALAVVGKYGALIVRCKL